MDASTHAYAAVVYLRVMHSLNEFSVALLAAKSKVALIKTISVPRLKLNAIVLLTRLFKFVQNSMNLKYAPVYSWTNFSVVLPWLQGHPSK